MLCNPSRFRRHLIVAAAFALAFGSQAMAQSTSFPSRPITLVVPFPAGGPSDALARGFAKQMGDHLGQPVVIENLAGAGGTVGLAKLAKAAPNGYTLGFGTIGTHVANVALYKKLPYDPVADFMPIGLAGSAPMLLVARADLPASNLQEFDAWLRNHAATASYGSAGVGSISHYGCVLLLAALKRNVTHVPYKGVAPAISDLMGGQTDFMCDQTTTALPQLAGGKIKVLAVLSSERLKQLPSTGTAKEAGYPLDVRSWNAIFAPKGTPENILAPLSKAMASAAADPQLRRQMQAVGVDLPAQGGATPAVVSSLISRGLRDDVPALKAKGQFLD
ncbi:tripartite tricarboxylate transporter substrate-binding protein [Cupriavidus basilensis]|uniref:tripartite tricarboxylate transporter substrate-binding protein n=1 Tax=Cupriavidus basilensis TaxID=68895 RepID=UPI0020A6A74E|nr:tripartite tricarboxylate transporter substrate-binding protein [Cupriavidus basilensis]MCP3019432.1 tripartite tricarboxylate transporter substrate-binding protein [Cupriavidus basilensis]